MALAAGGALYVFLVQTVGRRFRRSLKNNDNAFWMISQRILPPVVVWLMRDFFQRLPIELEGMATIDGVSG